MWRPDDWEKRLDSIDAGLMGYEKSRELVEAGADAMLKALRSEGFHISTGNILEIEGEKIKATKKQTLVLIPDEE